MNVTDLRAGMWVRFRGSAGIPPFVGIVVTQAPKYRPGDEDKALVRLVKKPESFHFGLATVPVKDLKPMEAE